MMASFGFSNPAITRSFHRNLISQNPILSPFSVYFPLCKSRLAAIQIGSDGGGALIHETASLGGADLLRKPVVSSPATDGDDESIKEYLDEIDESEKEGGYGDTWVDWEDQILAETVPLVGFVRMILHSGKYESGERLSPEHEKTILERLLAHHPECEKKIGCGVGYITIGYHPNFDSSRCLFIVRKDGELVDFSYWKCIKGLIRKNYPLFADSFILRHFKKRRR